MDLALISLVGSLYKLFANVVENMLKKVVGGILFFFFFNMSCSQDAFAVVGQFWMVL